MKEIKIALIQFRDTKESMKHEAVCVTRELGEKVVIETLDSTDDNIRWNKPEELLQGYDGIVLGGSGDFDFDGDREDTDPAKVISQTLLQRLTPLLDYVFERDLPTFGICYGHQLIAAYKGVQVICDHRQKKSRSHQVTVNPEYTSHPLFEGVDSSFYAHYGHKDSLEMLPENSRRTVMANDQCTYPGVHYQKNIFTFQFHPELTLEDMIERLKNSPGYLPEGMTAQDLYKDDIDSNRLLQNFAKYVRMGI